MERVQTCVNSINKSNVYTKIPFLMETSVVCEPYEGCTWEVKFVLMENANTDWK